LTDSGPPAGLSDAELAAILAAPTLHDTCADRVMLISWWAWEELREDFGHPPMRFKEFRDRQTALCWLVSRRHPKGGEGC
jgi:hypothetical protein